MANQLTTYQNIGKLGKPFGLDLQLRFFLKDGAEDIWHTILQLNQAIFIGIDGFKVPFFIKSYDEQKSLVQFKKVDSEDLIKEMSGAEIYVAQSDDMAGESLKIDHFTSFEIIDANTNKSIGMIDRIEEYPAHPMAIILKHDEEILIPIVDEWIVELREQEKQLVMELPEGLV